MLSPPSPLLTHSSKTMWANLAVGVPLQPKKALRKLDPESSQDDLICAVEECNQTVSENECIQTISFHAPTTDNMYNVWSTDLREQALMPFARTRPLEVQDWWDIQIRIQDYPYLDY